MSNSIAKIFIVINFVLSIAFMFIAGTLLTHEWDYKQLWETSESSRNRESSESKKSINEYKVKSEEMEDLFNDTKKEVGDYKAKFSSKETENKGLKRQVAEFQATLASLETDIKNIDEKLGRKEARISELENDRDTEKDRAEEALRSREAAEDMQQELEIQLSNMQGELSEKEKLLQRAQKELLETKQVIRLARKQGLELTSLISSPKALDGFVTAVSKELPIIMLSLGQDDGVAIGYRFTVYRGNTYVGRAVVEQVYKDAAAARIDSSMTTGDIRKGDKVSTRINRGS